MKKIASTVGIAIIWLLAAWVLLSNILYSILWLLDPVAHMYATSTEVGLRFFLIVVFPILFVIISIWCARRLINTWKIEGNPINT